MQNPANEERLTSMERDAERMQAFMEKLDASVEKLTAISADVTQLLAVHENRLSFQERGQIALEMKLDKKIEAIDERFGRIHDRIDEVKAAVTAQVRDSKDEVLNELADNTKKIATVERWMWTCLGGGSVLLFALDKVVPALT